MTKDEMVAQVDHIQEVTLEPSDCLHFQVEGVKLSIQNMGHLPLKLGTIRVQVIGPREQLEKLGLDV